MPLRDVTSVVFDRGNGPFNEAAALEAYHLIAKMDDAEASEFILHVVNEVVETTITENVELVQKHLDRTIAKALVYTDLDAVAAGLNAEERVEVKKQLLSAVSKASDAEEAAWKHRDKSGRFAHFEHPVKPGALSAETAKAIGIPAHPDHKNLTEEQRASYRAQYMQIVNHLDQHGGFNGNNDVRLHYGNGTDKAIVAASKNSVAGAINPHEGEDVEKVTIRPYKPTIGGQVTDLTASLGAGAAASLNTIGGDQANMGTPGQSGFVQQWYSASPTNNQQMYNRIGAGSKLIEQVSNGSPKLQAAAKFGGLVGQHGSQAENVFGPPVRRMAYRYRGTERKPDRALAQDYGDAVLRAKQQGAAPNRQLGEDVGDYQRRVSQTHAQRTPTWQERQAGREVVINWLSDPQRAPSKHLSSLQLAAGHTPPSEGVLLNADGQIVTTAVGAADDWYLPFNLRHLQSLKGGEYIRSRSTGGLTTEDVYTGLMTGARRVTVVSRSGVYSIELDPELRGGRRNNDKALRMSKRYGELLDAVQSGTVERQSLSPEAMVEVRSKVNAMYPPNSGITPSQREQAVDLLIRERKEHPETIDADILALDERRINMEHDQGRELTADEKADFEKEKFGLLSQKEYFHKLNGLGYQAAQDALKEQFPYYIASTHAQFKVGRSAPLGSRDRGYVEPGALRPTAARANLFGGVPQSGRKMQDFRSARTAGRAVPEVDRYGRPDADADQGAPDAPDHPKSPSGGGVGMPIARTTNYAAQAMREGEKQKAALKVHGGMDNWVTKLVDTGGAPIPESAEARKYHEMTKPNFAVAMDTPGAPDKFFKAVKQAFAASGDPDHAFHGKEDMVAAMDAETGGKYSDAAAVALPDAVYEFPDATELEKADAARAPLALDPAKTAGEATPEELTKEAQHLSLLIKTVDFAPKDATAEEKLAVVNQVLGNAGFTAAGPAAEGLRLGYVTQPETARAAMHSVQLVRSENQANLNIPALLAAPARRHPSGREFTPEEQVRGTFYDSRQGREVEI